MKCEWCSLSDKEREWLLYETANWSLFLADIQDYIGRCILVLNRHCEKLSDLSMIEWVELKEIVSKLEQCFTQVLGAEMCNWSCLMNDFYKYEDPNPHLHMHVRPRYKKPAVIYKTAYADTEFGHHYALKKEEQLSKEDRIMLYEMMRKYLN